MKNTRALCSFNAIERLKIVTEPRKIESLLRQCGEAKDVLVGRCLHAHIVEDGHDQKGYFANILLQMYGKCQAINDAKWVFSVIQHKDHYSWTFMIGAYAQLGQSKDALHIYQQMQRDEVKPDAHAFIYLLSACVNKGSVFEGRHVHMYILCSGMEQVETLATALVCMYSKCGSLNDALEVFHSICEKDTISWNAIISVVSEYGVSEDPHKLFERMQAEGLLPSKGTFSSFLNGHQDKPDLSRIKMTHTIVLSCGFHAETAIVNALVTMYGKCGSIEDAHIAFQTMPFQNVISWTAMIATFVECRRSNDVVQALKRMLSEGITPDKITFTTCLASCASEASLSDGLWLHSCICHSGFESDVIVGSALVTMYGKCGSMEGACRIFEKLPERDLVCWNTMIALYAQHEQEKEALDLLQNMGLANFMPNKITFISILDACADATSLDEGRQLHACLMQYDFESEIVVVNVLINFYGKCGSLVDAQRLFDKLPHKTLISWTAIIAAYGQQGLGKEALLLLEQMRKEGLTPNEVTFVSILSSCRHAGMVDEAFSCFLMMQQEFSTTPTMEHFDCLVDLLGRAGLYGQALIGNMPIQPIAKTWMTFLSACKLHNSNIEAEVLTLHALEVDSDTAAPYVLFSNICSAVGEEKEDIAGEDLREQWDYNFAEAS